MQTQGRVAGNVSAKTTLPEAHSRGYLPHIEEAEFQMITYRLGDALPTKVMQRLAHLGSEKRRVDTEQLLDAGYGQCWLAYPNIAKIVIDCWKALQDSGLCCNAKSRASVNSCVRRQLTFENYPELEILHGQENR